MAVKQETVKLDPVERVEIIAELELKTGFIFEYLNRQEDAYLIRLLKERG